MPSTYAHYRFGARMLETMPAEVRRTVSRHRHLYDVGLHGPDPFFYFSPPFKTKVGELGHYYHTQTGKEFFTRVCRNVRMEPSEGALAYLYGVLGHFCLDSICHPQINAWAAEGPAVHVQIESEFDRYLLVLDGKTDPHAINLTHHMVLTPEEAQIMSRFYPGANGPQAGRAVKNMAFYVKALELPKGARRKVIWNAMHTVSPGSEGLMMTVGPDPQCCHLDEPLKALYDRAEGKYPEMLQKLNAHLSCNAPLGEDFDPTFG